MSDPVTDQIMDRINVQITHSMEEMGKDAADDLRELISVLVVYPKSYKGKRGNKYVPAIRSSPGEPPRKDTGALQASVKVITDHIHKDEIAVTIVTDTEYDQALEFGTKHMQPRPFAGPTEAKWGPILENRLTIAAKLIS